MVFKINYPFMISPVLPEARLDADYYHKGIKKKPRIASGSN